MHGLIIVNIPPRNASTSSIMALSLIAYDVSYRCIGGRMILLVLWLAG
jgi:hypothetical protein